MSLKNRIDFECVVTILASLFLIDDRGEEYLVGTVDNVWTKKSHNTVASVSFDRTSSGPSHSLVSDFLVFVINIICLHN